MYISKKNPEKNPHKDYKRKRTLAKLKGNNPDTFWQTSEPLSSDPCARLKTHIPMLSISLECRQNNLPSWFNYNAIVTTFSMRLESRGSKNKQFFFFLFVLGRILQTSPTQLYSVTWPLEESQSSANKAGRQNDTFRVVTPSWTVTLTLIIFQTIR